MLLSGFNHVATLTNDSERLHAFYREVFEAEVVRDAWSSPTSPVRDCRSSRSVLAPS